MLLRLTTAALLLLALNAPARGQDVTGEWTVKFDAGTNDEGASVEMGQSYRAIIFKTVGDTVFANWRLSNGAVPPEAMSMRGTWVGDTLKLTRTTEATIRKTTEGAADEPESKVTMKMELDVVRDGADLKGTYRMRQPTTTMWAPIHASRVDTRTGK